MNPSESDVVFAFVPVETNPYDIILAIPLCATSPPPFTGTFIRKEKLVVQRRLQCVKKQLQILCAWQFNLSLTTPQIFSTSSDLRLNG